VDVSGNEVGTDGWRGREGREEKRDQEHDAIHAPMPLSPAWWDAITPRISLHSTLCRPRDAVCVEVLARVHSPVSCSQSMHGVRVFLGSGSPRRVGTAILSSVLESERVVQVPTGVNTSAYL
jgi:hypothetical protein